MNPLLPILLMLLRSCTSKIIDDNSTTRHFPGQFFFGVSTASYQIEGMWKDDGKGENIWDHLTHTKPYLVVNQDNGDVACDSYNLYQRDVEMLEELGVDFYRFSLSWSRILPTGFSDHINVEGVNYYNNLIDALLAKGIQPLVTLYHWDLPQKLQDIGGWTNPLLADYFVDYAEVAFNQFGDRVKNWITLNEPRNYCREGYGAGAAAPILNLSGLGDYMCGHTALLAHGKAYRLYDEKYRIEQKGSIGITLDVSWPQPASTNKKDQDAADRYFQFTMGWFAHPIFSKNGNYPTTMITRIGERSEAQGFTRSRLPSFTESEIKLLRGSSDFLGVNHYTSELIKEPDNDTPSAEPSSSNDIGCDSYFDKSWPGSGSDWLKVVPWGFKKLLLKIKEEYDNPEVVVTENGFSTLGGLKDEDRIFYINRYLNSLLDAIEEDCKVSAYTYWSLMDNFEWMSGYRERFGLYEVDFKDKNRRRTPRASAKYFAKVIKEKAIEGHVTSVDGPESALSDVNFNAILV